MVPIMCLENTEERFLMLMELRLISILFTSLSIALLGY